MPPIDPKTSAWINVFVGAAGAVLGFLASTKLPSSVPAAEVASIQEWSAWLLAGGTALAGSLNVYLHAVSSDKEGPLAK